MINGKRLLSVPYQQSQLYNKIHIKEKNNATSNNSALISFKAIENVHEF